MPKNYKDMIDEIINKIDDIEENIEVEEDAPANAAGSGAIAGIGVGPDGEPGIPTRSARRYKKKNKEDSEKRKFKRDPLMFAKPIKRRIKENNDNNNVVLKSILDGLDRVDVAIDKMNNVDVEVDVKPLEEKKSLKEKYKFRNEKI